MELLLAVFLFAVSSTITPGPNNIMVMTSGLNFGVRSTIPHLLGVCIGFPIMVILLGLGLGLIFDLYPFIHEFIKIFGVLYLLYLAWKIANSTSQIAGKQQQKPFSFIQAALFQWLNPKAWIMATSAIAAYTSTSGDIYTQVLLVGLVFFIVAFPCMGLWLFFGVSLKKVLKTAKHQLIFNISMAVLLVLSVVPIIYDLVIHYFSPPSL